MERTIDVAPVRGRREQRGRAVTREELAAVFRACGLDENQVAGARDAAILALLYGSGLRRSEVTGLSVGDFKWKDSSIRVLGKGKKERTVFMPAGTVAAVRSEIPLRGGMAYGECLMDAATNTYVGIPIVDAHETEMAQNWIGGALHPSCFSSALGKNVLRIAGDQVVAYPVPTKCGSRVTPLEYALWWHGYAPIDVEDILKAKRSNAPNKRARVKVENTLRFVQAVSRS